jgi:hypothetical protein
MKRALLLAALALVAYSCAAAQAQVRGNTLNPTELSPVVLRPQIAQVPPPGPIPTDVTPIGLGQERELLRPGLAFRVFQKLPERLWFNVTTEVTQRLETNVFFTNQNRYDDYVFRVLPNVSLGYNILERTSVYCNYFVIKDVYAKHGNRLTFPTTQSLALGFRQEVPMGRRTSMQLDFQARELWQTAHLHQADLIPGITLTHIARPDTVLFGNVQLQMRGGEYFVAPTREIDPFYTLGFVYRKGQWVFSATDTFVTNFRSPPFNGSIPRQSNVSMIADFELSHPISKKIPATVAFLRAEPIWNWESNGVPGLSGFDFRFFSGIRIAFGKPSYLAAMNKLRQQLLESEDVSDPKAKTTSMSAPAAPSPDPQPKSPTACDPSSSLSSAAPEDTYK